MAATAMGAMTMDGGKVELGQDKGLQSDQFRGGHAGEVHLVGNQRYHIGDHNAQQNRNDLDHALAPNVRRDNNSDGQKGQPPVRGGVIDRAGGQGQANEDDDGPGDYGGQVAHDLAHAQQPDQSGQHQIHQASYHDAAQGVGQLFLSGHIGIDAGIQLGHRAEAAQIGKEEPRNAGTFSLVHTWKNRVPTPAENRVVCGKGSP